MLVPKESGKTKDKIKPVGVGLKASEWERVQKIAEKEDISPHALTRYAILKFIQMYEKGEITIETETKRVPKMP